VSHFITGPTDPRLNLDALTEVLRADRESPVARLVSAQEAERARIAANVHDDSIPAMAAVALRLETLRDRLVDPLDQAAVEDLTEEVLGALARLRRLIFDLSPRALEGGLAAGIEACLREAGAEGGFGWDLRGEPPAGLPVEVQAILYRVAQEAIRNAQKHASPAGIRVELGRRDGGAVMRVVDDGRGFRPEAANEYRPGHAGLCSMRARMDLLGGSFRLDTAPGAGCAIEVWVPDGVTAPTRA
jgi:signal transduction histidine kinase